MEVFYGKKIVPGIAMIRHEIGSRNLLRYALEGIDEAILKASLRVKEVIMNPVINAKLREDEGIINAAGQKAIHADIIAEKVFIKIISELGVSGVLYSEESGKIEFGDPNSEKQVVILLDPLDGSKNFKNGFPVGCISVAYGEYHPNPKLADLTRARIINLYADEEYHAVKGLGAWFNGEPISENSAGSSIPNLRYYSYAEDEKKMLKDFDGAIATKSLGSVAWELAMVASNTRDIFVDTRGKIKAHDFAASKLVIEEAGGIFDSFGDSNPNDIILGDFKTGYKVVASRDPVVYHKLSGEMTNILK